MAHEISGNEITLTRGDTLRLIVEIIKDGAAYTPESGDSVRFALKHSQLVKDKLGYQEFIDEEPLVVKSIPIDTMILVLRPEDTKGLGFGKYTYDIEITFADGTVDTFIANEVFRIAPEVH